MAAIKPYLERIVGHFDTGYDKVLQFDFTDTGQHFAIPITAAGTATLGETTVAKPDITITTTTDVLAGILDKKVNPMTAFATRKIKVAGAMNDMMKLQKLLL